jgi:hypothetical protein
MKRTTVLAVMAGLLVVAGAAQAAAAPIGGARSAATPPAAGCRLPAFGPGPAYHPHIDPAQFAARVDNPWFPLPPGRTLVYAGSKDGKSAIDVVRPSSRTRVVAGVRTRIVEDRLYLGGVLTERTADYYAQDRCGTVWYFGEDTAELDRQGRVVDTSGSFLAGVDGAQPGVFMPAHPRFGQRFRQEWYAGEAEDVFTVTGLHTAVRVPYGSFRHALRTGETTALEPGVVDQKFYVRGIGPVSERAIRGGTESLVLVDVLT